MKGRIVRRGHVVGAAFVALATLVVAQEPETRPGPPAPAYNDTRVSLHVKDQPIADVIAYLQERSGINIVLAEGVKDRVSIDLDLVPWRLALESVAEKAGCVLVEKAANLIRVEQPPRVTFEFSGAEVRQVIDAIAKVAGASVVVAPNVEGAVYLRINDVPWRTALETVAKSQGLVVVEDAWNILRVVHPSALEEQLETRVFPVRYLRPPAPYVPKIKTEYAEGNVKAPTQDPEKDFTLIKTLRSMLSKSGKLDYIARSNIVVVKDVAPVLSQIARVLQEVDVEPAQIFVDVKFVTTSNNDVLNYGIDPGDEGLSVALSGGAMSSRLPFHLGGGSGWNNHITAAGITDPVTGVVTPYTPALSAADAASAGVTFGKLDFTRATFTLNLLKKDDKTRIVQSPKLLALDNQEATIFVGRTVRFAQTEAEQGQAGGLTFTIKEAANSPVQTGFQLYMIPHIIPGTNKIMMTLIPEAEQLVGRSSDPNLQGFQIFKSGEGTPNEVSIALPQIASSTMVSTMLLESGYTAVIGGLITDSEIENVNKVPILGDIPILDFFFSSKKKSKVRESLLIFITPRIVRDHDSFEKAIKLEELRRQKAIEAEYEALFNGKAVDAAEEAEKAEKEAKEAGESK
jgi:type II secretory pathway component GspD/PulD (secretin)